MQLRRMWIGLCSVATLGAPAEAQIEDELKSTVVRAALLVLEASDASTWPEFMPPREFVVCPTSGGGLYALRDSSTGSSEWRQLAIVRGTRLYRSEERPPGLDRQCFNLNYEIDGRKLLSFPQRDSIYSLRDPVRAMAAILVHEEFHRHQFDEFAATNGPERFHPLEAVPRLPPELLSDPDFQRLARQERQLLSDALAAETSRMKRSLVARYLELRERRLQMVPERLRAAEAHEERKEGPAHLVSYEFVMAAANEDYAYVVDLVQSDLLHTPEFDENPRQSSFRHWHIYATGAAIGIILDQLGIEWRQSTTRGATLLEMLKSVTESEASRAPPLPGRRKR